MPDELPPEEREELLDFLAGFSTEAHLFMALVAAELAHAALECWTETEHSAPALYSHVASVLQARCGGLLDDAAVVAEYHQLRRNHDSSINSEWAGYAASYLQVSLPERDIWISDLLDFEDLSLVVPMPVFRELRFVWWALFRSRMPCCWGDIVR